MSREVAKNPAAGLWTSCMRMLAVSVLSLPCASVHAMEYEFFNGPELSVSAGTLGIGVEVSLPLSIDNRPGEDLSVRFGAGGLSPTVRTTLNDVQYRLTFRLLNAHALLDWHPWSNGFRMTAGLYYNANRIDISAEPNSTLLVINDTAFAANVGTVDGDISANRLAPYLGIGWDGELTVEGRWALSLDAGFMYHGRPKASLEARCAPSTDPVTCALFRREVDSEEDSLNRSIRRLKWYPVVSVGGSYRF